MPEGPAQLTILQLTHQGEGAGSTQSIFSLSRELAHRGHRVLVGCPAGTLLARSVAATPSLEHVALDFSHFRNVANTIAGVIADKRVNVANSHATGDRRALTWLRWRRRRSEEHTSELQSRGHLVCRLLLESNFSLTDTNSSLTSQAAP